MIRKSLMDVGTRGGRRQSKRVTNNVPVNEDKNKDGLSQQHVIRLEEELVKFPNPSVYYKKKIAARLTKEFNVPERIIINWLNENGKRDMSKQRTVTPTLVQSKQDFTEIKKEIIEQPKLLSLKLMMIFSALTLILMRMMMFCSVMLIKMTLFP